MILVDKPVTELHEKWFVKLIIFMQIVFQRILEI